MKSKNEKVPGFDEIIFENRNKEYGAYDLRKRYNAATGISILGGIAVGSFVIIILSIPGGKLIAEPGPVAVVIEMTPPILNEPVKEVPEPPAAIAEKFKNIAPVVSTDTNDIIGELPVSEDLFANTIDGSPTDTSGYVPETEPIVPNEPLIYYNVAEMPEYPGGIPELLRFISKNLVYPEEAMINNVQGRVVVKFAVNTDGSVYKIAILNGIDTALDSEAIRVVKFKPGRQNGVPVPVWFSVPITFRLQN